MTEAVRLMIAGRVQGVGYRAWVIREATRRGIEGWVRNRRDGSVEAVFSGTNEAVAEMTAACRNGPAMAEVASVESFPFEEALPGGFEQRPTG